MDVKPWSQRSGRGGGVIACPAQRVGPYLQYRKHHPPLRLIAISGEPLRRLIYDLGPVDHT